MDPLCSRRILPGKQQQQGVPRPLLHRHFSAALPSREQVLNMCGVKLMLRI